MVDNDNNSGGNHQWSLVGRQSHCLFRYTIAGALLHQRAVHDVNFVSKASWIVTPIVAAVEQASQSENHKIFDPNRKPSPSEVNPLSHIPKVSPIVHYFLNTNAYLGLV